MKKIVTLSYLLFFLCFIILSSCDQFILPKQETNSSENNADVGRVYIYKEMSRSILPDLDEEYICFYELYIAKPGDENGEFWAWSYDLKEWGYYSDDAIDQRYVTVPVGTWDFILRGLDSLEYPICKGRVNNVNITKNHSGALTFRLETIKSGYGNIYIEVYFPEDAGVASVITTIDGEELDPPLEINDDNFIYETDWDVESGDYLFNFKLLNEEGKTIAVITEIVVVRENLESYKLIELTEDDINVPPQTPYDFSAELVLTDEDEEAIYFTWTAASGTETGFVINDGTDDYEFDGNIYYCTLSLPKNGNFMIKAFNDFGDSPWSESIGIRPTRPENLSVTSATETSISLSWDAAVQANTYRIYRAGSNDGIFAQVGTSNTTSYNNTGLTAGTTYYYKVAAYNTYGESSPSSDISAATKPSAPTDVTANATTTDSITVRWNSVNGAEGYYIYRSTISTGTYIQVGTSEASPYTDTSLAASTTYYYKVSAYNSSGESSQSSYISAIIILAPANLTATSVTAASVTISWASVSGATGYRVYRSSASTGTYTSVGTSTTTSYNNTGLTAGTTYYYKVAAYNAYSEGVLSADISVTTIPPMPTDVIANIISATNITVSWNSVNGAVGYRIYRATTSTGTYTQVGTSTTTSYSDTGLTTFATTYYYKVSAYNTAGEGSQSSFVTALRILSDNVWFDGTMTANGIHNYQFNATQGNTYRIYWNDSYEGDHTKTCDIAVSAYWEDTGTSIFSGVDSAYTTPRTINASRSGTIILRVQGYSSSNTGTYAIKYTVGALTTAPTGITASTSITGIAVSWNSLSGAGSYRIYRAATSTGTYTFVGTSDTTSYSDTGLSAPTTYYYKVSGYNTAGEGPLSSYASATTSGNNATSYTVNLTGKTVINTTRWLTAYQGFAIPLTLEAGFNISDYTKYTVRARFFNSSNIEIPSDYGLGEVVFLINAAGNIYDDSSNCLGFEYNLNVETINRNFSNTNTATINMNPGGISVINSSASVAYIEVTEIRFHN
jgi:fibronectin type 3 domain-containing protein